MLDFDIIIGMIGWKLGMLVFNVVQQLLDFTFQLIQSMS